MYRVVDDDQVQEQVAALPAEALSGYAEARTLLEVAPWSGSPYRTEKPDGSMRTLAVGNSGALVYLSLEQERVVHVLLVQWIG
ncbi:MAG: hypothetical protein GEU83_08075 [Pseudonocardiaceae bacterium]|nr:hypothetical protein [Pseudonocardiaceae bacterium]